MDNDDRVNAAVEAHEQRPTTSQEGRPSIDDLTNDITPVFRIISVEHFQQLIEKKKLTFRRIDTWSDKNECLIDRIIEGNVEGPVNKWWYGSCWTITSGREPQYSETEAMWKCASSSSGAVRISTTLGKLASSIFKFLNLPNSRGEVSNDYEMLETFHGGKFIVFEKVNYVDDLESAVKKRISQYDHTPNAYGEASNAHMNGHDRDQNSCRNIRNRERDITWYLCQKKSAFRHEEEFRCMIFAQPKFWTHIERSDEKSFEISINLDFITSITFHPELSECCVDKFTQQYKKILGNSILISKSTMYDKITISR